jgi:hypothetical protein
LLDIEIERILATWDWIGENVKYGLQGIQIVAARPMQAFFNSIQQERPFLLKYVY